MGHRNRFLLLLTFALAHLASGCQRNDRPDDPAKAPSDASTKIEKIDKAGLHNFYRINDKLLSGRSPEGEEGFRSLKEMGVLTIISVDGAKPDVALARKFGLAVASRPNRSPAPGSILKTHTWRPAGTPSS